MHTTHLISLALDTASRYCGDKHQLQSIKICSCEVPNTPSNPNSHGNEEEPQACASSLYGKEEPQACASSLFGRHPGSIDWQSFSRFSYECGHNISNLELDNINFKDVLKPFSEAEEHKNSKNDAAIKEAEEDIRSAFEKFKKIQNLTLRLTKTEKDRNSDSQIHITPQILSCSFMKNSLRVLRLSLADIPDHDRNILSDALSSCLKLEELSLRFAEQLSARDLEAISILPRLKRLGISNATRLRSCDFVNSFRDTKTKFTKLTSLSLVLCSGIDARSLEAILGADEIDRGGEGGRNLQDLDIYADGLGDEILYEIQNDKEGSQPYLSYLKSLCAKYFAVNVTLIGVTPGAFFKLSNLEKLDNDEVKDRQTWWSKLRQLRCNVDSPTTNECEELATIKNNEDTNLSPSPPPEYSNFTVLDSHISCHINSVPTVVLTSPSSSKCR